MIPFFLKTKKSKKFSNCTGFSLSHSKATVGGIAPTPPAISYQAVAQLGRIGNNLNQLLKAMNSALAYGQELPNVLEAMQVVEEVHALLKALQVELLGLKRDTLLTLKTLKDDWQNN